MKKRKKESLTQKKANMKERSKAFIKAQIWKYRIENESDQVGFSPPGCIVRSVRLHGQDT